MTTHGSDRPGGGTSGSSEREPPSLSGEVLNFNIATELESLKSEPTWQQGDRNSRTLVHDPSLSVVIVAMKAGAVLREHRAPGPITVHVLEGHIDFAVGDQTHHLDVGHMVVLEAALMHEVTARGEGAFLLTIACPSS